MIALDPLQYCDYFTTSCDCSGHYQCCGEYDYGEDDA